jgi:hypothetical protein
MSVSTYTWIISDTKILLENHLARDNGKHKCRWYDNIKLNLEWMSCKNVSWIALRIQLSDRLLWWWWWTFYWTQKVHQFILKSLQMVPIVSQNNPVSTNIHYFKDLFLISYLLFHLDIFLSSLEAIQLKYAFLIFPCVIIYVLAYCY